MPLTPSLIYGKEKKKIIAENKRLELYETLITPILLYNCGTWGLTKKNLDNIDTTHRKHLRKIIGIKWPDTISNADLYERCRTRPISDRIVKSKMATIWAYSKTG